MCPSRLSTPPLKKHATPWPADASAVSAWIAMRSWAYQAETMPLDRVEVLPQARRDRARDLERRALLHRGDEREHRRRVGGGLDRATRCRERHRVPVERDRRGLVVAGGGGQHQVATAASCAA
jgi:hypothetical protein